MTASREDLELAQLGEAELFRLGSDALYREEFAEAYRYLGAALERERSPEHLSQYALALARHKGEFEQSVALCQEAIRNDPRNPEHFLRLGTVYLIAGRRKEAVRIFHLGLRVGRHPLIVKRLQTLGQRRQPVLSFLSRTNPLNKYLGKIRNRFSRR